MALLRSPNTPSLGIHDTPAVWLMVYAAERNNTRGIKKILCSHSVKTYSNLHIQNQMKLKEYSMNFFKGKPSF